MLLLEILGLNFGEKQPKDLRLKIRSIAKMEIWQIPPGWKRSNSELQDGICRINKQ